MEQHEHDRRVRPLNPGTDRDDPAPAPTRRDARAIIAGGLSVVAVALIIVVFGIGGDEPEPPVVEGALIAADAGDLAVTTTTLPPRLSELLPVPMDRLSLVTGPDDARTVFWGPHERYPRSYRLPAAATEAWFDAEGESVAFVDARSSLFTGPTPGDAAVRVAEGVTGVRFHPTDPGLLAFTTSDPARDVSTLYRVSAEPDPLGRIEPIPIADLPGTARLLTWGAWGYAIALDAPEAVMILDVEGAPLRAMSGRALGAGGDALLVDARSAADTDTLSSMVPDVWKGNPLFGIVDVAFAPIYLFPGEGGDAATVTIADDGLRIAVATFTSLGGTSITIRDRSEETLRTIRIDTQVQPIGFVGNGDYLAFRDAATRDLVVADWRTGARYRVPGVRSDILTVHF